MKILYGVQGTGHGHISRAKVFLPLLRQQAHVDVLISGYGYSRELLEHIDYEKTGMSLMYDSGGKVSLFRTARHLHPLQFYRDIRRLPVHQYDLVISDFEPVSAWAAQRKGVPSVGMSHQSAFLSPEVPRPSGKYVNYSGVAERFMEYFAPADRVIGFHYRRYDDFIEPPLIREGVRCLDPKCGDHYTVYLPACGLESICKMLKKVGGHIWHVFSKECKSPEWKDNILLHPVDHSGFLNSIRGANGVVTHAGFGTTSEAMYLRKKLFVIPIGRQYEQLCNREALRRLGAWTADGLTSGLAGLLRQWIKSGPRLVLPEVANPEEIVNRLLSECSYKHQGPLQKMPEIV